MTARQLLGIFRRRLWLIGFMGLLGACLAYGYSRLTLDNYTATGILAVQPQRLTIPELQGAISGDHGPDPLPEVLTEVQVLTSPRMLQQVVVALHLDLNPEFNPLLRASTPATGYLARALGEAQDLWDRAAAELGIPVAGTAPEPGLDAVRQVVLGELSKRLVVSQDSRSLIINLQCTAQDPKVAAAVVNTLIGVYERARFEDHEAINKVANASLTRRIEEVRTQAVALEQKVRSARSQNDLPELARGNVSEQQLSELITAANRSSVERTQATAIAARARTLAQAGATDELAAVVSSATISRLREQETQASRAVAETQNRYGDSNPALQSARASLRVVQGQIVSEVRRTVASLDAQAKTAEQQDQQIQAALAAARVGSHQSSAGQLEIRQLEEEAAARRKLYETLLTRAEQTQTDPSQQMVTGARVVSEAFVPALPSGPRRKLATGIGGVGGVLAGGFLALVGSRRIRRRFFDGGELASAIGVPVLARLPRLGRSRPTSESAGPLRLLRSRIRFNGFGAPARTVAFVAAGGRADVAGTAIAFARLAAMDGERVLLIEGSVTQPRLVARFGADLPAHMRDGLQQLLLGAVSLRDAVGTDPLSSLEMLLVDKPSPALLGLMQGSRFQMLLADAAQNYSLIIMSAPSPDQSETLALAHAADATIFVVGGGRVRPATLQASVAGLADNPRSFVAAVLAN